MANHTKVRTTHKVLEVTRDPEEGHFVGRVKVGKDVLVVHCKYGSWMLEVDNERFPQRDVRPDIAAELAGKARQIERAEGRRRRSTKRSTKR